MSTELDALFMELDAVELPIVLEGRWLKLGLPAYEYLLSRVLKRERATEHQVVNAILLLSRMRFERDPDEIRRILATLATDLRMRVRSVATQCLAGTLRADVVHRGAPAPAGEYLEAIQSALQLGLEEESTAFVLDCLQTMLGPQ